MDALTRRSVLRAAGGAVTTSAVLGGALLSPAAAALRLKVELETSPVVGVGGELRLRVAANPRDLRSVSVVDASGLPWRQVSDGRWRKIYAANPSAPGRGSVTVTGYGTDGSTQRATVAYEVTGTPTTPGGVSNAIIGMSALASVWDQRVAEVGPGVRARRIFADLADGATSQLRLVEEAHAAGQLPVISYKLGGDIARGASGGFNAVAEDAARRLEAFGRPAAVSVWHEPNNDLSPAQYTAISRQLLPIFKRGQLKVGPILNGFLLDRQVATFGSFAPDELFRIWDWVGIDTYEGGTIERPGERKPAPRIPALSSYIRSRGYDLPIGIGEYNGYSAETIAAVGEAMFTTPNVWFGCMWNSEGERARELTGDRLAAFRRTLTDPRAGRP